MIVNATEIEALKKDANQAFDKEDYKSAFDFLWETGVDVFASYVSKKLEEEHKGGRKAKKYPKNDFFWDGFIYQEDVIQKLFSSSHAQNLLHFYFTKLKRSSEKLISELSKQIPHVFVEAVRVNQLFLNDGLIGQLTKLELPDHLQAHSTTWKVMHEQDATIWNRVETEFEKLESFSFDQLFVQAIIWIEQNRFGESEQQEMHLSGLYCLFAELLTTQSSQEKQKFETSLANEFFFKKLMELSKLHSKKRLASLEIHPLMISLSEWQGLSVRLIQPYSFDLTTKVQDEGGKLTLREPPMGHYTWRVDEARYEFFQTRYQIKGAELLEFLKEEEAIKISQNERDMNESSYLKSCTTASFLKDLHLESFEDLFGEDEEQGGKFKHILAMIGYSTNRLFRYELQLYEADERNDYSKDWVETYLPVFMDEYFKKNRDNFPYILKTVAEYKALNEKAENASDEKFTEELLKTFAHSPEKHFDRHNRNYDIWEQPFLKIGEHIFTPTYFFASNGFMFSYIENELLKRRNKKNPEGMEQELGERLLGKNWEVKVADSDFTSKINPNGDVDIFVQDETATVFIQLKRTKFQLTPKEAYYELVNVDEKATEQLNKAEKFLKERTDLYEAKRKPTKWVVSTSFEKTNVVINDCRKINYFELLNAISNPKLKTVKSLRAFLEKDEHLKDFISAKLKQQTKEKAEYLDSVSLPIECFNYCDYRHNFWVTDSKKAQKLDELSRQIDKLVHEGKHEKTVNKCLDYLDLNPLEGIAWSTLAGIIGKYGLRDNDAAFKILVKASELLPNDPYVHHIYALQLVERDYAFDGCMMMIELATMYPLMESFRTEAKEIYMDFNWNDFEKARLTMKLAKL